MPEHNDDDLYDVWIQNEENWDKEYLAIKQKIDELEISTKALTATVEFLVKALKIYEQDDFKCQKLD